MFWIILLNITNGIHPLISCHNFADAREEIRTICLGKDLDLVSVLMDVIGYFFG